MQSTKNLKKKTVNGILWKGMERCCAQLVSMIVSIVLARILMPEDYSVVSVVHIFFTFCNLFISEGINSALIQKRDADELDYSTVFIINMGAAVVLYLIMFFAAPKIAQLYNNSIITPVIRVMALTFFINGYKAVLSAKISSDMQFKKYFMATIGGTLFSAAVGIIMALRGAGAWALVAQQMSNSFVGSVILTFTTRIRFKFCFSYERFKRLFDYGGKIFFASIITTIYNQIKPLIVGIKFSASDLAFYNKGESFPSIINSLISSTLTATIFPAMAKLQDNNEAIRNVTHRYICVMSYLIFPSLLGFFAVSDNFVRVVLTDKWIAISPYIKVFCIAYILELIQIGNINAIKAIGRSDLILKMEIIKKSIYTVIIIGFVVWGNKPVLLAVSAIVCNIVATVVNTCPNRKLIGYGYVDLLKDILPNLVISVIMCVVISMMNRINMNIYLLFFLQIITGVLIYLALSLLTKNNNFRYVLNTIRQVIARPKKEVV